MKILKVTILLLIILMGINHAYGRNQWFSCDENEAIHKWIGNGFKVIVCSYGYPPTQFKKNWWRGHGLSFYKIKNGNRVLIKDHSEYYPKMDYSYHDNTLTFIIYTYDPRKNAHVPFLRETVLLNSSKFKVRQALLLPKPKLNPAEVDRLFSILSLSKQKIKQNYPDWRQQSDVRTNSLYMLRNYGLINPEDISTRLSRLRSSWWHDGLGAGDLRDVQEELKIIKSLTKH